MPLGVPQTYGIYIFIVDDFVCILRQFMIDVCCENFMEIRVCPLHKKVENHWYLLMIIKIILKYRFKTIKNATIMLLGVLPYNLQGALERGLRVI